MVTVPENPHPEKPTKAPAKVEARSPQENERFKELEDTIDKGLETVFAVGVALKEIRDSRLYRGDFETFEDYLRERWNVSRSYCQRMIDASETKSMFDAGDGPLNEAQARALTSARNTYSPTVMRGAWEKAVADTGGKPTAEAIAKATRSIVGGSSSGGTAKPFEHPAHPTLDALVPPVDDKTYQRLKESININGLRQPVIRCGKNIIDGRARQRACIELGKVAKYRDMPPMSDGELTAFILDANVVRRQLPPTDATENVVEGIVIEGEASND